MGDLYVLMHAPPAGSYLCVIFSDVSWYQDCTLGSFACYVGLSHHQAHD